MSELDQERIVVEHAHLDSINDDIMIADVGMIYVFVCFDCNEVKALIDTA